jgi:hypothetical protein
MERNIEVIVNIQVFQTRAKNYPLKFGKIKHNEKSIHLTQKCYVRSGYVHRLLLC